MEIHFTLNGRPARADLEPRTLLLDWLRESAGLTGAKRSCEVQVCGACTVLVDGLPVSACCLLAIEVEGREVTTVEGLEGPLADRLRALLIEKAAVQCGFCTSGMLLTLHHILSEGAPRDGRELAEALRGNLCRCTGYRSILEAGLEAAR